MSNSLVIVAIPEDSDRVWKISSEEIPHLTLLFLGDAESNPHVDQIMQFVQHATELSEHGPFYLDVDRRGTLGADEADVLFFNQRSWNLKWIKQFRNQLLQNGAIRTAYDSVEQFPEWNPHLTLGYPETPAKPLGEDGFDHPFYSVSFDRIAVWTGNFEGPDFRLEWPDREEDSFPMVAMSSMTQAHKKPGNIEDALEHFGVKGMRWGQRKTETVTVPDFRKGELKTKMVTPKKAAKMDKQWEKEVASANTFMSVYNDGAAHVNSRIGALNDKFEKEHPKEFNDGTLLNDSHPVTKAYHKEFVSTLKDGLNKSVSELSNSPTGKKRVKLVTENDDSITEFGWSIGTENVSHAAANEDVVIFVAKQDAQGRITNVKLKPKSEDSMQQTVELGTEFLEHFGVKGMRWGVRKEQVSGAARSGAKKAGDVAGPVAKKVGDIVGPAAKTAASKAGPPAKKAATAVGDRHFKSQANSSRNVTHLIREATNRTRNEDLPKINAKYQGKTKTSGRLKVSPNRLNDTQQKAYREEVKAAYVKHLNDAANQTTSGSGNYRYEIAKPRLAKETTAVRWRVKAVKVEHAVGGDEFDVIPVFDADGYIVDFKVETVEDAIAQSIDLGSEFLAHFGVKGMRWGVRNHKGDPVAVTPQATSKVPHGTKRKTKIEVDGGENHPAHEDAVKVAEAKAKLQKSGTAALSNKELQDVANRIQLEERVKILTSSKGKKFVKNQFQNEGQNLARQSVRAGTRKVIKKAAIAAI